MVMIKKLLERYIDNYKGLSKEVWLLTLITLINRTGTIVVLFLSIYLTEQLGFSKTQAGIVMACFGAGSLVGSYAGGFLTDRVGYYNVMFWSLVLSGLCFFLLMMMTNFIDVCLVVFLTTAIGDMFRPASSASLASYSNKEDHTRALSLHRLAINLGFATGGAAAGLIAGRFGYNWLFIIDGVTCILAGFSLLLLLKEMPDRELEASGGIVTKGNAGETILDAPSPLSIRSVYTDHWYIAFLGMLLLCGIVFMQLFSSFPVYAREALSLSKEEIGFLMAFNGALIVIFEMPIVAWITHRKKNMISIILGTFMIGFAFILLTVFTNIAVAVTLFIIAVTFGEILSFPFNATVALQRSVPGNRGQYMGLFSITFSISAIVGNSGGLYLADKYGFTVLWLGCAGLVLLSVVGLIVLKGIAQESS